MLWFALIAVLAVAFGVGALLGAPYLPILARDQEPLLDLAEVQAGSVVIDLGSGDGRLLRACAKRGATAIGYEINPFLFLVSLMVTWRYRQSIRVHLGNYWTKPLPEATVIYVFLIERFMAKLDHKLASEVTRPTTVVSFVFKIPGHRIVASNRNAFVYRYGELEKSHHTR